MKNKSKNKLYRFCRYLYRTFTEQFNIDYSNVINSPAVYVVHHQNLVGPITILAWLDLPVQLWVLSVFFNRKACLKQYYDYTFTKRFGMPKLVAAIAAFPLSFLIPKLMESMKAIPVFRASKAIIKTFQQSIKALLEGNNILLCPDVEYTNSSSGIGEIYDGFLDLEKYYAKQTGKHLPFVPLHINNKEKRISFGNAIYFTKTDNFKFEKSKVFNSLKQEFARLEKQ